MAMDGAEVTLNEVPEEMLVLIMGLLDGRSLVRAHLVCRSWHRLTSDPRYFLMLPHYYILFHYNVHKRL
jgi:hypothetical protein